ncbi:hypothetical protein [Crenothrix sp.]|uniref:hypothetical protein n=1 Tax=Crenothrix sp. TaxID=3100433 RepID=UPI00374C91FD
MKNTILQNIAATTLLTALSYGSAVSAHTANGALAAKANAVDVYQMRCFRNSAGATGKFVTRIRAAKVGALISAQAYKGRLASQTTDPRGGNALYSPVGTIAKGGEGLYTILVDKSGVGANSYVLIAHCETARGVHSGETEPALVQNQ